MKLDMTNDAKAFWTGLEKKQFKQVGTKLVDLMSNPRPHDSIEMKSLAGYYRTDIGEFRIIYKFDKETVYIVEIGRRNDDDVYAQFDRRKKK